MTFSWLFNRGKFQSGSRNWTSTQRNKSLDALSPEYLYKSWIRRVRRAFGRPSVQKVVNSDVGTHGIISGAAREGRSRAWISAWQAYHQAVRSSPSQHERSHHAEEPSALPRTASALLAQDLCKDVVILATVTVFLKNRSEKFVGCRALLDLLWISSAPYDMPNRKSGLT